MSDLTGDELSRVERSASRISTTGRLAAEVRRLRAREAAATAALTRGDLAGYLVTLEGADRPVFHSTSNALEYLSIEGTTVVPLVAVTGGASAAPQPYGWVVEGDPAHQPGPTRPLYVSRDDARDHVDLVGGEGARPVYVDVPPPGDGVADVATVPWTLGQRAAAEEGVRRALGALLSVHDVGAVEVVERVEDAVLAAARTQHAADLPPDGA